MRSNKMFERTKSRGFLTEKNSKKHIDDKLQPAAHHALEALEQRTLLSWGLDPSFGSGGIVKGPGEQSYDVAVQGDGKVLVADDRGLIRYNANGSIDTSFGGGDGIADWGSDLIGDRKAIALLPGGKIIAADSNHAQSGDETALIVVRFNSDGTRDSTFGENG